MNIRLAQDSHDILINQTGKTGGKLLDTIIFTWSQGSYRYSFRIKYSKLRISTQKKKKISSFNCASQMGGYDITTFWLPVQTRAPTCQTQLVIFRMNNFRGASGCLSCIHSQALFRLRKSESF